MRFLFLISLFALTLASCSQGISEEEKVDIYQIQTAGTLSTTEYVFGKIVQLDDKVWYKFGDRKILISVKAKVKAGIDLSKISSDDIEVEGNKITVHLPFPEIVSFDMDPNFIRTKMEDVSGLREGFTQEEKLKILQLGEQSIRKEMMSSQILHDAKKNASVFVRNFYHDLGFNSVEIKFNDNEDVIQKKL
ncbi:MAG: DUF4230 domain-containing protein [Bacteroidota bacterium]